MRRKSVASLVGALALIAALVVTAAALAAPASKLSGTLRVSIYLDPLDDVVDPATGNVRKGYNHLFKQFEELHPGVKISGSWLGFDGRAAKTQTQLLSNAVDVLLTYSPRDFYMQGLIKDLRPLLAKEKDVWDSFVEAAKAGDAISYLRSRGGAVMALPADLIMHSVAYDKKIFNDWGIEPLSMRPTAKEIREKLPKVTGRNPKTGQQTYGLGFIGTWQFPYLLHYFAGGSSVGDVDEEDYGNTVFKLNTPEFKKKILTTLELMPYAQAGFLTGQGLEKWGRPDNNIAILFWTQPPQMLEAVRNGLTDRFVVTYGLRDYNGKTMYTNAVAWSIAANTKVPDLAWEFVKWAAGYQGQRWRYENIGYPPSIKNPDFIDEAKDPYLKSFLRSAEDGATNLDWTPFMFQTLRPWMNSILAKHVNKQKYDLDEELANIQRQADEWARRQRPVK